MLKYEGDISEKYFRKQNRQRNYPAQHCSSAFLLPKGNDETNVHYSFPTANHSAPDDRDGYCHRIRCHTKPESKIEKLIDRIITNFMKIREILAQKLPDIFLPTDNALLLEIPRTDLLNTASQIKSWICSR